jgi:hypothetical protein
MKTGNVVEPKLWVGTGAVRMFRLRSRSDGGIPCIELKLTTEGLVNKLICNKVYIEQTPFFPT